MKKPSQQGQALTEFIVVSTFLLVPLFLIVPILAKVISQKQDVELGARYAAWERTVWYEEAPGSGLDGYQGAELAFKSDANVAREIDARIFASDTQRISSSGGEEALQLDPFAHRQHRQNGVMVPILAQAAEGSSGYATSSSTNSEPGGLVAWADAFGELAGAFTRFDMPTNGVVNAEANVKLADLSGVFGSELGVEALSLSANNALYTESWEAGGREHAEYRIQGLMLSQYLDNDLIDFVQDVISALPLANELHSDCLIFGYTTIEPLPNHRLENFDGVKGTGGTSCSM
ncbi:hypothetical protein ACQKFL_16785 [Vreelandella titanicae]|uniref:hypothetical protein n=1 Tax=Vreelandella titanicae TaxID=664683 RepID=UPI003D03C68C|tara:strand:+ start:399 stop:1268 length:870 start_codon:yes stop_codon:yes gene_type:complete